MRTILASVLLAAALPALAAEPRPADPPRSRRTGRSSTATRSSRRSWDGPPLRMCNAEVVAKDVQFLDGTLEFDLAVSTRRNFPMVGLRRQGVGEYEEFYFRTHKTELPDAIQYVPAWQGVGGWQLYHGPGFTAKATFPRNEWFPVRDRPVRNAGRRLRRQRRRAAARRPERCGASPRPAAWSSPTAVRRARCPRASTSPRSPTWSSGRATSRTTSRSPRRGRTSLPPGVVPAWEISETFVAEKGPVRALPEKALRGKWQKVAAEPSGLVVFERHVKLSGKPERETVLARLAVDSPERGRAPLRLRLQRRGHGLPQRPAASSRATPATATTTRGRKASSASGRGSSTCRSRKGETRSSSRSPRSSAAGA